MHAASKSTSKNAENEGEEKHSVVMRERMRVSERAVERDARNTPVNSLVIITAIEELDLLKGLLAGIITGQVRMHSQKQIERCRSWNKADK